MPFTRPTLEALRADARAAILAELPDADPALRFTVLAVLADVLAAGQHLTHGHLDWIARQVIPDTAEADFLDRWCRLHGLARRPATRAAGTLALTGIPGTVLPAGAQLTRADGVAYATTTAATIGAGGTAAASVEALAGGAAGNAEAGAGLTLTVAVVGIEGRGIVTAPGLTGGGEAEADASLRERLRARLSLPPQGGAAHDYLAWALAVTGVTRAWVFPRNRGLGTVDLAFTLDGRTDIFPLPGDVAAVQAAIDAQRPVCDDCVVFAPTPRPVAITIQGLSPDTPAIRAAILAELADQIFRDAAPGGDLRRSRLIEAISRADGEFSHTLVAPAADLPGVPGQLCILGSVSYV